MLWLSKQVEPVITRALESTDKPVVINFEIEMGKNNNFTRQILR